MKSIQKIAFLLLISVIIMSCSDEEPIQTVDPSTSCGETMSDFQNLFQTMINDGYKDEVSFDTEIHEYTFTLSEDKEVCQIGYQSYVDIKTTAYLIEIIDNSSNKVLYSDNHVFSSQNTYYVTPSRSINLKTGVPYTIKRIQTDWGMYISNTIGRIAHQDSMNFPYTYGIMTITNSNFYQNGGPLIDMGVPYIDLILK